MYKRILVALDGSPSAQRALAEAVKLAKLSGGVIEALCVVDRGKWPDAEGRSEPEPADLSQEAASVAMAEAEKLFSEAHVRGKVRAIDAYAESIPAVLARAADECEADLIVMGTHGRRGVKRFLLGSVAETLVRTAERPVLVVRHDSSEHSQS
jgi:nucleotide-binding universal stress UspA family protein